MVSERGRAGLTAGGLVLAAGLLMAVLRKKSSHKLGTVAGTSAAVAAVRAIESQNPEPLFVDPLAEALAGPEPMHAIREHIRKVADSPEEVDDSRKELYGDLLPVEGRQRRLGWVQARTIYLDKAIHDAMASHKGSPQQVVLLGAGLDTRPWRMALPDNIRWFEVDQLEVIQYKHRLLKSAGAAIRAGEARKKHPLAVSSWKAVATDLSQPQWQKDLLDAGFDPNVRTIWLAEGLVNYIPEAGLRTLLSSVAEISTKDSLLLVTASSEAWEKARTARRGGWRAKLASVRPWGAPSRTQEAKDFFKSVSWETVAFDDPELTTVRLTEGRYMFFPRLSDVKDALDIPADYLFLFVQAKPIS